MSGRLTAAPLQEWATELDVVGKRIARHFPRVEPRQRALGYLRLLLSDVERKNGWQIAERFGDANPFAVQHLLGRAVWDADAVRDDLVRYLSAHLGNPEVCLSWAEVPRCCSTRRWRAIYRQSRPALAQRRLNDHEFAGGRAAESAITPGSCRVRSLGGWERRMGWDIHITRAAHWAESNKSPITAAEWLALVAADPELRIEGKNGPYFAVWSSRAARPDGGWFDWADGRVTTKNPDRAVLGKSLQLATKLGAAVQDDDGEVYSRPEDSPIDGPPTMATRRPWWRFW